MCISIGIGCSGMEGTRRATPVSEKHIRSSEIMVVFAGPFASLNAGLLCWLIYLQAAGDGVGWTPGAYRERWRFCSSRILCAT